MSRAVVLAVLLCWPVAARATDAAAATGPAPRLTRAPRLKAPLVPEYPAAPRAEGIPGDVTLQVDIDAEGRVTAAEVVEPAGHGFDDAARDAMLRAEFEPALVDDRPSPVRIRYTVHFRPPAPPPPPQPAPPPPPASAPPPAPEQVVIARGRLREKGTRDPIAGADVIVARLAGPDASDVGAVVGATDEDGRFAVEAAPGARVRVSIASGEHEPCVREFDVVPGAPAAEMTCTVARRVGPRYETVVSRPAEGEEATRHTISQTEMTTVPGTFGDPLRVIQTLPGVARSPYGLGLLIIRGASPQDSGVYVDGHRVPLLYHFLGGPSVLTPDLLERIDFYPGGFGVRYGRATAGVVDVTTRSEPLQRVHGSADVDFLDSSAYLEGPLGGGFSAGAAARRSYVDVLLPYFIPKRDGSSVTVVTPVYWDYQARVTRQLGNGRLDLFAFGSDDSLKVYSSDPERGDIDLGTRIGFHRFIATWASTFGAWSSRLSPSYGYDLASFGAGSVGANTGSHVFELREELSRTLAPWFRLAAGLDGELRFERFSLDIPLPPERRTYGRAQADPATIDRRQQNAAVGTYVEALWDLRPDLRVVPGVRLDYFHLAGTDKASVDPRVVVRWARRPGQAFILGAGVFHQAPLTQQLDPEFGNPDLPLLWADQYHAGIEQALTRALSVDATLYYLRRHELPVGSARQVDGHPERYAPDGKGRGYGLELRLKHAVTQNFYGWISYTLSRSEAVLVANPDPNAAPAPYAPTDFDQTHNFILVASRRLRAWELGMRFRLVTGIPQTPIAGATYDADYNTWQPLMGPSNSTRRQTFHQLDLRVERTFTFDAWRFSAYLDVQNVYNAQNPEATIYDFRYQNSAPVRGLPILPILGLRGRF